MRAKVEEHIDLLSLSSDITSKLHPEGSINKYRNTENKIESSQR